MEQILIQLYFCQYGWPIKKIAELLNKPASYVEAIIKEEGYTQGILPVLKDTSNDSTVNLVKNQEIQKQAVLAPLYTVVEATLLDKLLTTAKEVSTDRIDAHDVLKSLVSSLQVLKQNSITSKMFEDKANAPGGIHINLIQQIL